MSVWAAVDRLVDRATDPAALRAHGLQLLAARRWRAVGRPIPTELLADERAAAIAALAAPLVLARVRAALPGPIVVLKGLEVAARYPDPALRPLGDVDLLVPDTAAAQRALLAAGFEPAEAGAAGEPPRRHHLPPLRWPGSPLPVELHHALRVPPWMSPPTNAELVAAAVPSSTGVAGVLALPPPYHTLVLAAHSWSHGPLSRLLDLIDVSIMMNGVDVSELNALTRAWGMHQAWAMTGQAIDALLFARPAWSWPAHFWAWHLGTVRERTLLEERLVHWLGALRVATMLRAVQVAQSPLKTIATIR